MVLWLEFLRGAWGGPVFVNSGWRCAAHNSKVGGAPLSRHLTGCAADIGLGSDFSRKWPEFLSLADRLCRQPGWEFRLYRTYIHAAVPRDGGLELWDGGAIRL